MEHPEPQTILDRKYLGELAKQIDEPGTFGKLVLWIKLRSGRIPGFSFVNDYRVAGHTLDFYCPAIKLGIDVVVAGGESKSNDTKRKILESRGVISLRFTDEEILEHTDEVLEHIRILATAFIRIDGR